MSKTVQAKSINLGQLQAEFENAEKLYRISEKEMARAQELRDGRKVKYLAADIALKNAVRTVLG